MNYSTTLHHEATNFTRFEPAIEQLTIVQGHIICLTRTSSSTKTGTITVRLFEIVFMLDLTFCGSAQLTAGCNNAIRDTAHMQPLATCQL